MNAKLKSEKGQAIVMIAFAITGLLALVALAMDGGHAFSDRRQAQNAIDAAALAVALQYQTAPTTPFSDLQDIAWGVALANGYPNDGVRSSVTLDPTEDAPGECPKGTNGKKFTLTLVSNLNTWFAPIVGIPQVHNTVKATARGCVYRFQPFVNGMSIFGAGQSPAISFNTGGGADINITCDGVPTGGIQSNGDVDYGGSGTIISPSLAVAGSGAGDFTGMPGIPSVTNVPVIDYPEDFAEMLPAPPICDGVATLGADGYYHPSNTDSRHGNVTPQLDAGQKYAKGTYCTPTTNSVSNSWNGHTKGPFIADEATFYVRDPNFDLNLAGDDDTLEIQAPADGFYAGYAFIIPFFCGSSICTEAQIAAGTVDSCTNASSGTPRLDWRGNAGSDLVGAVWAPSSCIKLMGNSDSEIRGQIVGYQLTTGGTTDITICYQAPENPQEFIPPTVELVK